jgi:asparagine synthase (glutamine-hydrolysing)
MCGIVGFVDLKHKSSEQDLKAMVKTLEHRGPDSQNSLLIRQDKYSVGLGHTRLSIIDLTSSANQPMQYEHLYLIFNGEIYNYKEIKAELQALGHHFETSSDTEVILHAYQAWGKSAVKKFIGMFAIVIFDRHENQLILWRDRAGVKPLYVYQDKNVLLFSSELKAFHKHFAFNKTLNINAVEVFFNFGYIPSPHCIFKNAYKVEAGECICYNLNSLQYISKEKYWSADTFYGMNKIKVSYPEAKKEVKTLLESSYNYRLVSDVPVGVFLSGGYDSTSVAAILQDSSKKPIKTFTIGFNEGNNEAPYAKKIAKFLRTEHYEYYCTANEAKEVIPDLAYYYDEPFADSSAIPTTLVSKFAKKEVTVALSADGGDEIFSGYNQYEYFPDKENKLRRLNFLGHTMTKKLLTGISTLVPIGKEREKHLLEALSKSTGSKENRMTKLYESVRFMPDFHKKRLFTQSIKDEIGFPEVNQQLEPEEQLMLIDYNSYLQNDILTKVDRATMAHSLEGREPLLDHRIIEYVSRLPIEYKLKNGIRKRILKDIVHDYIPEEMMRRPKTGFSIPVLKWLNDDLSFYVDHYLSRDNLDQLDFINTNYALELVKLFKYNKLYYSDLIWRLLIFMMWWEKWK